VTLSLRASFELTFQLVDVKDIKKNVNVQISLKFEKLDVSEDDFNINLKISSSSILTV